MRRTREEVAAVERWPICKCDRPYPAATIHPLLTDRENLPGRLPDDVVTIEFGPCVVCGCCVSTTLKIREVSPGGPFGGGCWTFYSGVKGEL